MSYQVMTWNNAGARNVLPCASLDDAKKLAKDSRTLDNRVVKICDVIGTLNHWIRVVGERKNRWSEQTVAH